MKKSVTLSFDIGHSSIGWAALETVSDYVIPEILGSGSVIFPSESCQAKEYEPGRSGLHSNQPLCKR